MRAGQIGSLTRCEGGRDDEKVEQQSVGLWVQRSSVFTQYCNTYIQCTLEIVLDDNAQLDHGTVVVSVDV